MKKLTLLFIVSLVAYMSQGQTIYIANNNPGAVTGPNIFTGATAFDDAYAAAVNGDIIYVIPSATNYGKITADKGITIYGIGFYPDKSPTLLTNFTEIDITDGADNLRISGITFSNNNTQNRVIEFINSNFLSMIIIDNCRFQSLGSTGTGDVANLVIQNNIIDRSNNTNISAIQFKTTWANVRIAHNIIYGDSQSNNGIGYIDDLFGGTIEHNLFVGECSICAQFAFEDVHQTLIRNNIFYWVEPRFRTSSSNNTINNNISYGSANPNFQGGNGNMLSNNITNTNPLLNSITTGASYNFSNNPTVDQVNSPALGAAEDGTEIGLFGGASPFDKTGTPLPIVQSITVAPNISQGSIMNVRIVAKGN